MTWIEEDSNWMYGFSSFWEGDGYAEVTYEKDTIIEEKLCQVLLTELHYIGHGIHNFGDTVVVQQPKEYLYQNGDTIWLYRHQEFVETYNFSYKVGDVLPYMSNVAWPHVSESILEDIQTVILDGREFRKQLITTYINGLEIQEIEIIEKLGLGTFPYSLFWQDYNPLVADQREYSLRCYSDSVSDIKFSDEDCRHPFQVISNVEEEFLTEVQMYPNPFSDKLYIDLSKGVAEKIQIIDLNGQEVLSVSGYVDHINTTDLTNGYYTIKIIDSKGRQAYIKMIKTD